MADSGTKTVITFEDLHAVDQKMGPLPSGYAGFTWSENAWFATKQLLSSVCPGVPFGLLNAQGQDITMERKELFHLRTLSLCTLWWSTRVLVEGWEKGVRKYATTLSPQRISPATFDLEYRAIDRVTLKTEGAHILINAITLRFP